MNNVGDLTYPYIKLDGKLNTIKEILNDQHKISTKIKDAKKPIIIFGQSALITKFGKYIFESIKSYLIKNKKISNDWNSLNVI